MNAKERKEFLRNVQKSNPGEVRFVTESEDDHKYAVVEVISDDDDGLYVALLATANQEGICWAWEHSRKEHPCPSALLIMDMRAAQEHGTRIDFH